MRSIIWKSRHRELHGIQLCFGNKIYEKKNVKKMLIICIVVNILMG